MGSFKKITDSTNLLPGMQIREYNKLKEVFDFYEIASYKLANETYEVYPNGDDTISKNGVNLHFPQLKMIAKGCEYWDEE